MSRRRRVLLGVAAGAAVSLAACSGGAPSAGAPDRPVSAGSEANFRKDNEILLAAASPFEDLTEAAMANDAAAMDRALTAIEEGADTTVAVLAPDARQRFGSALEAIRTARSDGRSAAVALDAVEAYRLLVESLHEEALAVPKAVSLLDYAGFKLNVLAGAAVPDWDDIRAAAAEASSFWRAVAADVADVALRDAMSTTIDGLDRAVAAQDARMVAFAARIGLDLVDLLERSFEQRQRPGR